MSVDFRMVMQAVLAFVLLITAVVVADALFVEHIPMPTDSYPAVSRPLNAQDFPSLCLLCSG